MTLMPSGRTDNRTNTSIVSIVGACQPALGILLLLAVTACGALTAPDAPALDTPANQRYWHDVNNVVVLHWDASAYADSYTIDYRNPSDDPQPRCPRLLGETRSTTAAIYIGEDLYRNDCSPEIPCLVTTDGEQSRSTFAANFEHEIYVVACNSSGCSESDTAKPAQLLLIPDGPAPPTPTGFKAMGVEGCIDWFCSEIATIDASVNWDHVEEATYYELWVGSVPSSTFRLGLEIPRFGGYGYTIVDGDNKVDPVDTPVNRGPQGEWKTTGWKVRACTKAGCSPFSKTITID